MSDLEKQLVDLLVETTYALRSGHKTRFPQADKNRKFLRELGVNIDDQRTASAGCVIRVPHNPGV